MHFNWKTAVVAALTGLKRWMEQVFPRLFGGAPNTLMLHGSTGNEIEAAEHMPDWHKPNLVCAPGPERNAPYTQRLVPPGVPPIYDPCRVVGGLGTRAAGFRAIDARRGPGTSGMFLTHRAAELLKRADLERAKRKTCVHLPPQAGPIMDSDGLFQHRRA